MVKQSFHNNDAPNCPYKDGRHLEEVNYPNIADMNPRSFGKIQSKPGHTYVYPDQSQMPKRSLNPERHQYASESELVRMKLVK